MFVRLLLQLAVALFVVIEPVRASAVGTTDVSSLESTDARSVSIREIRPGVWIHTSHYTYPAGARFPSNGLIVREADELVLIDTAWGELATVEMLRLVEREIGLPVRRALITHAHYDRSAGADVLESNGVEVLAHSMTLRLAAEAGTPIPDQALTGLDAPGDAINIDSMEVLYPGPGHAPDNLMVWLPAQRILFGGCAVRADDAASPGNIADADLDSWRTAVRRAQARYPEAEVVVPGHGKVGGRSLLSHTLYLLEN